ncbi:threonine synthase [Compostibacter hankyongensis]|uniref:Threonine synthase n=1 Tax=Compostibacter hankyongensis TaxID=1007089 RepID=A0ABP8FJ24_9BACT
MQYYSTKDKHTKADFPQAVFQSLPPDNGLYMPEKLPRLEEAFIKKLGGFSFPEIAFRVASALLEEAISASRLREIIDEAVNFPAPAVPLGKDTYVLELFHGPSLAFKDFGARFMSRVMAYFLEQQTRPLDILVATSGDTGGAVALGFYDVPHIRVTILYPSGKVSPVQEQQLTTLGKNIRALEVKGSFDDCQRLVKQAFLDPELSKTLQLSSANSINIARLIPQTFYYFHAWAQLQQAGHTAPPVFSVPSGNFGNLTAGVMAWKMGLPVARFVASTNVNDEVPVYLRTGVFEPRPSLHTLSNAMDVGNPSNFARLLELLGGAEDMGGLLSGYSFTDEATREAIRSVFTQHGYVMCPHTAVAYLGLQEFRRESGTGNPGVFLSTAHPCKFPDVYETDMQPAIVLPEQLASLNGKQKQAVVMENDFSQLKEILLRG